MTLASQGAQGGYASALDVGGGGGAALDIGKTGAGPAPEAAAPATEGATSGEPAAPAVARPNLHDEVKIALLDLGGAVTIDAAQEYVNARPGAYVGRGPVEATLLDMEKTGTTRRVGDKFELVASARAEIENPEAVIARRALVVSTVLVMVMPDGNTFDDLEGASAIELQGVMQGPEGGVAEGALGPNGFEAKFFPVDVLILDLEALCEAGVFIRRTPAEEDKVREREQRRGPVEPVAPPKDEDDEAEEQGDEEENEEDEGEEEEEASSETTTTAPDDRPTCYTFAAGSVVRMISHGARQLVIPSLPVVSEPVREAAVANSADADANALISKFEQQASARLEQERTARLNAERVIARIRTHLATKRLEHLVDEALGPPAAPPERAGARKTFPFTQTVPMNEGEQAILFNELEDVEKLIAEWEARIEGAKLAASSTKTQAKEKIAELKEKKAALFADKHGRERTYTVEAYSELDTSAPHAVNRIRATSDGRLLKEEVLTPAAALLTVAKSEVVVPGAPAPASAASVATEPAPAAPVAAPAPTTSTGIVPPVLADVAAAETAASTSKTKTVLSQEGIRPFVLSVLAAAGEAGQADAGLDSAIASVIGTQETPTFHSLVRLVVNRAITGGIVRRRDDVFVYLMEPRIAELVAEAGENGLLKFDLPSAFEEKTGITMTDRIAAHMEEVLGAMVLGDKLSCGAMPGSLGDVLWPFGQTDPRKLSLKPKADASPAPARAPRGRGKSKAGGDASAKPADAAKPSDANAKKPAAKKAAPKKK